MNIRTLTVLLIVSFVSTVGNVFAQVGNQGYYNSSQQSQTQYLTPPAPSQSYSVLQQGPSVKAPWSPSAQRAVNQMWQMIAQQEAQCPGSSGVNPLVLAQHGILVPPQQYSNEAVAAYYREHGNTPQPQQPQYGEWTNSSSPYNMNPPPQQMQYTQQPTTPNLAPNMVIAQAHGSKDL